MKGIFINEDGGIRYAEAIVKGYKSIETRRRNMLKQLIGDRVAVVRTRRGVSPMVIGYVDIVTACYHNAQWLDEHRDLTLIPPGSKHDAVGFSKWCYFLENAEPCDPFPLPEGAVRHGRSWCEF